jgi:hypothetical protein
MTYETKAANIDWDGVSDDVLQAIDGLRLAWMASESSFPPEIHAKFVEDLYAPQIELLGRFIAGVQVSEE